jgi:[ribosomal protein S18]-alanine N-acetyltransferase
MTNSLITPVGTEAVAGLLEIENQCFRNPWSKHHFTSAINSPQMHVWVYQQKISMAGYIVLYIIEDVLVIANLAVSPDHRRKGIGEDLLNYGLDLGRNQGCGSSILDVRQSNTTAVSLYKKANYIIIGNNKGYYKNPYEDSYVMGRKI